MKIIDFKREPLDLKADFIKTLEMLLVKVKNDEVKAIVLGAYFGDGDNSFTLNVDDNNSPLSTILTLSLCSSLTRICQDRVMDMHEYSAAVNPPEE